MTIHKSDEGFTISSYGVWRPGCYEDERTAKYAFRFSDEVLTELQNSIHPCDVITFKMLQAKAQSNKRIEPTP